jgi:transcriptional regulator with XRE-family HTH domain
MSMEMDRNDSVAQRVDAIATKDVSGWRKKAKWRKENRAWLKRSQAIALRVLRSLRSRKMSQKDLAEMMGVTPQHISKIVKGRENLTLETIAKLEGALGIALMDVPCYEERQRVCVSDESIFPYVQAAPQRTFEKRYSYSDSQEMTERVVCEQTNTAA